MGMCTSSDMFQAKIENLLGGIKGGKMCINNILVLGKGFFC